MEPMCAMDRRRVLLADDHGATLQSWRALLEPEFEVVGAVSDGRALVDAYDRLRPDVIVTDIGMPGVSGLVAAETIVRRYPGARVVFATVHADRTMMRKSLAAGAWGYVLKVRVGEDLLPAVRAALRGELHISPFPQIDETNGRY
jgi:DNA-binding NarL/FixJ family response regulator